MGRLMKAEFYKLKKRPSVRMIFLFSAIIGILQGLSPYPGYQVFTVVLTPGLFDAALISVFTAAFLCTEFSSRTLGSAFLCGTSRTNVFLSKLAAYFPGLFILILLPPAVSIPAAAIRNGFGADWDTMALELAVRLFFYIFYCFFMASLSIFAATVIQNPLGTLGISIAVIYLVTLIINPPGHPFTPNTLIFSVTGTAVSLSGAAFIFLNREL